MQHGKHLALVALALMLGACSASSGAGLRPDPLPAAATTPCRHPATFLPSRALTTAETEILAGRLGDELIRCELARALAVEAYQELAALLAT